MNDDELPGWLKDFSGQGATAPAETEVPRLRPSFVLHPVEGVFGATFLGSFFAGGVVMALNFARLGEKRRAWITLVAGFVATAALVTLASFIPDEAGRSPAWLLGLFQAIIAVSLASHYQRTRIRDHLRQGGRVASLWRGAGIGLLCALPMVCLILGAAWYESRAYGERHWFGGDAIFLLTGASPSDATRVAKSLQEIGYFSGNGTAVQIRRMEDHWVIGFPVSEGENLDGKVVESYADLGHRIATDALSYPLTIELCDSSFSARKTVTLESSPFGQLEDFDGDRVYFTQGVRHSDARRLARTLKTMGWFEGRGLNVQLRRATDGFAVAFLVNEKAGNNQETFDQFHAVGDAIAESALGYPITIELAGQSFAAWKTIRIPTSQRQPLIPPVTL